MEEEGEDFLKFEMESVDMENVVDILEVESDH